MQPGVVFGESPAACITNDGSNAEELSMSRVIAHADMAHVASGRGVRRRLRTLATALVLAVLGGCAGSPQQDTTSAQLAKELGQVLGDVPGPIHYFAKQVDLNGDGRAEFVVHVAGPMVCGTGGCDTFVFAQEGSGLRLVSRTSVTRPPIVVATTTTQGWRDLVVRVSGGGIIAGYDARLRFDGRTYPANPTVPPAEPLKAPASGEVAIPAFQSFIEGRLLRAGPK
jgi:hypothetical protein